MFVDFFYHLRQFGLKASSTEWLALMRRWPKGTREPISTPFTTWLAVCW